MNPARRIAFRERTLRHGLFNLRVAKKKAGALRLPALAPSRESVSRGRGSAAGGRRGTDHRGVRGVGIGELAARRGTCRSGLKSHHASGSRGGEYTGIGSKGG